MRQENRNIKRDIEDVVQGYFQSTGFADRKLTDTPADDLQVVNRRYVNLNGTTALRPSSSVATLGQRYFATDTNIPMTFDGTSWRNGVGSIVAI